LYIIYLYKYIIYRKNFQVIKNPFDYLPIIIEAISFINRIDKKGEFLKMEEEIKIEKNKLSTMNDENRWFDSVRCYVESGSSQNTRRLPWECEKDEAPQ
ncbi:MAG: hypothetical protein ABF649_19965, partial [Bacillus sp. (in: firmicutes)]